MTEMVEWKRKNAFVREIRRFLKRFRIVEVKTEVQAEAKEIEQGEESGMATLIGQRGYKPTGRFVVNIRLIGYWRQK